MKNFLKIFIAAGLVLFFNANGFANVDFAIWGGYIFAGNIKSSNENEDFTGTQCGFKGHYYIDLSQSVHFGFGPFCQNAMIISNDAYGVRLKRNSIGVDVNFIFSIPSKPAFSPYVRANYSFYDKFIYGGIAGTISGYGFGIGGGAEFAVSQTIKIFFEFMYDTSKWEKPAVANDVIGTAFNMGFRFI